MGKKVKLEKGDKKNRAESNGSDGGHEHELALSSQAEDIVNKKG